MSSFFYNLGRMAGPSIRKGHWLWRTLVGSEGDEIAAEQAVGLDLAREMLDEIHPDPDESVQRRVTGLLKPLVVRIKDKRRSFRITVIQSPEPNGFALPGGHLFLSRSLIEMCGAESTASDEELSFVIAHEMAHVIRKHAIKRLINSKALSLLLSSSPVAGGLSKWMKTAGVTLLTNAHSQEDELEADLLGVRLVQATGIDPKASIRLLERLERSADAAGTDAVPRFLADFHYLATHPPTQLRIENLARKIL